MDCRVEIELRLQAGSAHLAQSLYRRLLALKIMVKGYWDSDNPFTMSPQEGGGINFRRRVSTGPGTREENLDVWSPGRKYLPEH